MKTLLKKYWSIITLLTFAFLLRAAYVFEAVIPFSFDHGKDAIAIMHLITTSSLKFIGPWTSIPGFHFGPFWYYLLAPAYWLGNFHPLAPVWLMIGLVLVQIFLTYKHFGIYPALAMAASSSWLMISKSAWNPFPMTFITLIMIIVLARVHSQRTISAKQAAVLGLLGGLGFSFSAAFAIFYPLIIFLILKTDKIKLNVNIFLVALAGFLVPFIPQMLFELKNDFLETRSLINYMKTGDKVGISMAKIWHVVATTYNEIYQSFTTQFFIFRDYKPLLRVIETLVYLVIPFFSSRNWLKSKKKTGWWFKLTLFFTLIPMIGFFFLHFNVWYVYAVFPVWTIVMGLLWSKSSKIARLLLVTTMIISSVVNVQDYYRQERMELLQNRNFLSVKLAAVNWIYAQADGQPFASYHYVPDIYDYSYQYLYFWLSANGRELPVEFSYAPGEVAYIPEKTDLLNHFGQTDRQPQTIFFIVEKPENQLFVDEWWGRQRYGQVIAQQELSPELTVFQATTQP